MAGFPNPDNVVVPKGDTPGKQKVHIMIGDVMASLLLREDPSEPVEYTQHPIESSEEITDYARDLPEVLTLDCLFFSDPVIAGENRRVVTGANGGPLATWEQKRDAIRDYKLKRTPIEVFTGYQLYPDRRIEDIILNRVPETSNSWAVTLIFNHVKYVKQAWASVPIDRIPKKGQNDKVKAGDKKGRAGKQSGKKNAPTKTPSVNEVSVLRPLLRPLLGGT